MPTMLPTICMSIWCLLQPTPGTKPQSDPIIHFLSHPSETSETLVCNPAGFCISPPQDFNNYRLGITNDDNDFPTVR